MFLMHAPEIRETTVFTRMPDRFRRTGVRSDWADANRGGQPTDSFLEGPVFDAAGNLYVTDIPFGRIFRIDPKGEWEQVATWAGEPNGMKFLNERELLVTDYRNGLMVCHVASGDVRPYLERRNSERFKGVNDLTFDSRGNLYFTDQGQTGMHDWSGRVFRLTADGGRLDCLVDNAPSPNGLALNLAENRLFVAITRQNAVWRVPLQSDGSASKVGTYIQMSGGSAGPDGMALDEEDGLIVCHVGTGVWRFDRNGMPTHVIEPPEGHHTTNVAFGGPDRRALYITESDTGTIQRVALPVAGKRMYSHQD
jgi:gluconolactonase